jgi:5-hydroxyisourate hydrolase
MTAKIMTTGSPGGGRVTLCVRVIDGVYGRPAVGVSARILTEAGELPTEWARERTDEAGRVAAQLDDLSTIRLCQVELDINGYFATLGITPSYRKISVCIRLRNSVSSYETTVFITPSSYFVHTEG